MTRPVVHADRDIEVLIYVEWIRQPLRKRVHNVVIGVRTIIELRSKRRLPLLGLHVSVSIRIVHDEAFEIEFPQLHHLWTHFENRICEIANAVRPLHKADRRIEIRPNLPVLCKQDQPVRTVDHSCTQARLPGLAVIRINRAQVISRTARLRRVS